jgi:hypothetical protein
MRRLILLVAAVLPLVVFTAGDADAQRRVGQPGIRDGGFRSPGVRPAGRYRPVAVRPGGQFRPVRARPGRWERDRRWAGPAWGRPAWRGQRVYSRRWGRPVYYPQRWARPVYYRRGWGWGRPVYYRRSDPWAWGAVGLATGVAIGAAAAQPAPIFASPIQSSIGGYCATPLRTCALISPAPVGTGCSCRIPGGRARGGVIGP